MTRRRIIFADGFGKYYTTPEFNGDRKEFEQFKMGDICTAEWTDIIKLFVNVSTLDEFKEANKLAHTHYVSAIFPQIGLAPVEEITDSGVTADEIIYTGKECTVSFTGANSTRFKLSDENISNKNIMQFYEIVAHQMGVNCSDVNFDCTKILISANIEDKLYQAYEQQHPDIFKERPGDARTQVTAILTCSGAKRDNSLPDNTVVVQDGFFAGKNEAGNEDTQIN